MVTITESDLLSSQPTIHSKCDKLFTNIVPSANKKKRKKQKTINLDDIGNRNYNSLLELLQCQSKVVGGGKKCKDAQKRYAACHGAVMGTGSYDGRRHCGKEIEELYSCTMT